MRVERNEMKIETHFMKVAATRAVLRIDTTRSISPHIYLYVTHKKLAFEYNKKIDGNRNQLAYIRPDVN